MTSNPLFLAGLILLLLLIIGIGLKYYNQKLQRQKLEEDIQDIQIQLAVNELSPSERKALEVKLEMLTQRIALRKYGKS